MENIAMKTRLDIMNNNSFLQILGDFADLNIAVFASKRLKKTWRLEKKKDKYSLVIPYSFTDAPDDIKRTLLFWAQFIIKQKFSKRRANATVRKQIKEFENKIYAYIKNELGLDEKRVIVAPQNKFRYTDGYKFDLTELFDKLNGEYFGGSLKSYLRWGKDRSRTSYHTVCRDEFGEMFHLITIAGLYNLHSVPEFAIEAVMYHEMLHIAYPPKVSGLYRNVHHKEFCEKEKQFPHYGEWKAWQKNYWKKRVYL